ncbi:phosphotransferase [Demequina silvatica]|uniref:phosphotransferase n=1 Tax=Demequina silvatica TaxID=1638988 RepID=UPI0007806CB1|nr:phosphotransferase [Demequina silvatica]
MTLGREQELAQAMRDQAGEILDGVMSASGARLERWAVDAVHARPGAEVSVAYDVQASGERLYLVATTARIDDAVRARIGAVTAASGAGTLTLWRHPADPRLPGLATSCVPALLGERMAAALGRPVEVGDLEMLVLRPMRRAVLRARVTGSAHDEPSPWYVKVVRPSRVGALLARHRSFPLAPEAWDLGDGIVLIAAADGMPMTEHLYRPTAPAGRTPLAPHALVEVLDALPEAALTFERRATPTEQAARYGRGAVAAGLDRRRVEALVARIENGTADQPGPLVPTHGDFHAANLFVTAEAVPEVTALIDVDTLGPGYRVDDLACMLAHLATLPDFGADEYADVPAWAARVRERFAHDVPAEELGLRTAAVLLSLAAGIEDPRLAESWLARAEREAGIPTAA